MERNWGEGLGTEAEAGSPKSWTATRFLAWKTGGTLHFRSPKNEGDDFYLYKLPLRWLPVVQVTKGPSLWKAINEHREQELPASLQVRRDSRKAPESMALISRYGRTHVASEQVTGHHQHKWIWTGCWQSVHWFRMWKKATFKRVTHF